MTSVRTMALLLAVGSAFVSRAVAQPTASTRGFFYVGGRYSGESMTGQMYVEVLSPARTTQRLPLIMIHGNWQTATNWIQTPDGRPGWADYFLAQGFVVYLVDQPARGRSPWHGATMGPTSPPPVSQVEQRFTAPADFGLWPQARLHTQWPGTPGTAGRRGDSVFDAFYASQVESLTSAIETQTLMQAAGAALLDKVGPAIVLTHSQSGALGWLLADIRPQQVKGIVAVEPSGPPFQNAVFDETPARAWGLADIPLTYDPPATQSSDLHVTREASPQSSGLVSCSVQTEPARTLAHLRDIPVLVLVTEASYHATYDHCTARFLSQAGVPTTFVRLEQRSIHGNGHMAMLEKNNLEVAGVIRDWLKERVR